MTLDLDSVMDRLRSTAARCPASSMPPLREVERFPAHLPPKVLSQPVESSSAPAAVAAWVDGVQASHTVCWVHHRPVLVQIAAAAAIGPSHDDLVTCRLEVVCSQADAWWVAPLVDDPWLMTVPDGDEQTILAQAAQRLDECRRRLEHEVAGQALEHTGGLVVVDGSLADHGYSPRLAGVVKTHRVAYLEPETHLHTLNEGQRTAPPFEVLDPQHAGPTARHSVYLRLHNHRRAGVLRGLVRLEAYDPAVLEPLARTCLAVRQHPYSGDGRWSVHLEPIAFAEEAARAALPSWKW